MYTWEWHEGHQCVRLPSFVIRDIYDEVATATELGNVEMESEDPHEVFCCSPLIPLTEEGKVFFDPSYYEGEYPHPHVNSNGMVCWGNQDVIGPEQFKSGNMLGYVETMRSLLHNYQASAAYHRLPRITGNGMECQGCGNTVDGDNMEYVDGNVYCNECASWCSVCEESYCNDNIRYSELQDIGICENCGCMAYTSHRDEEWVSKNDATYVEYYGYDVYDEAEDLVRCSDDELRWSEDVYCCEKCGEVYSDSDEAIQCCMYQCRECGAWHDDEEEATQCCVENEENLEEKENQDA